MTSVEAPMSVDQNGEFKAFDMCRTMLYWQGFWPDESEPCLEMYLKYFNPWLAHLLVKNRFLRVALRSFRRFNPLFLIISLFLHVFYLYPTAMYVYQDSSKDVLSLFSIQVMSCLFLAAACTLYFLPGTLNVILMNLEVLLRPEELDNDEQREIYSKSRLLCKRIIQSHLPLFVLVFLFFTTDVSFRLLPERKFPYREWFPWDTKISPAFEITLLWRYIQSQSIAMMALSTVTVCVTVDIMSNSRFRILNNKLENVRTISVNRIQLRKLRESVRLVKNTIVTIECEHSQQVNPASQRDIRSAPAALNASSLSLVSPLNEAAELGSTYRREAMAFEDVNHGRNVEITNEFRGVTVAELDKEMQDALMEDIQLHVKLIRTYGLDAECINVTMIVMHLTNTLVLGVTAMSLIRAGDSSGAEVLSLLAYSTVMNITYFVINNAAELISGQHDAVCESMYNSDWTGASPSFKKSMLVIMSASNVPLVAKPTGLNPLSRKNFAEVMNSAYKMFNTLSSMIK